MTRLREKRTTDPAKDAVDLQQLKAHLRLSDSDIADDPIVAGLVKTAIEACERYTGRALITQTWTAYLDAWPRTPNDDNYWEGLRQGPTTILTNPARGVELNHSPLQSITSIKTYNDSDTATVYNSSEYFVDDSTEPGRVVLRTTAAAPTTTRAANGIEIIYVAGYGDDPDDVPEGLRQSILAYVSHMYEHRGDNEKIMKVPMAVEMGWKNYKVNLI